jgi:hypothetical protein
MMKQYFLLIALVISSLAGVVFCGPAIADGVELSGPALVFTADPIRFDWITTFTSPKSTHTQTDINRKQTGSSAGYEVMDTIIHLSHSSSPCAHDITLVEYNVGTWDFMFTSWGNSSPSGVWYMDSNVITVAVR